MATQSFPQALILDNGVWQDNSYYPIPIIDTGSDPTLTVGEVFSVTVFGNDAGPFNYQYSTSDGGFVATNQYGEEVWFTQTYWNPGTTPVQSGTTYFVCFLAGTEIATPDGSVAVENLTIGDLVLTAAGQAVPVHWIGRQMVTTLFSDPLHSFPIHIESGALGGLLPQRDLFVSPDHALLIDGLLVHAGALVNGTSIRRMAKPEPTFTYYHVELADHSLILAEGVPAETFVDNVTRRRFDNWAEYEALYGEESATTGELDYPRVKSARQLPRALRAELALHAATLGYRDAEAA